MINNLVQECCNDVPAEFGSGCVAANLPRGTPLGCYQDVGNDRDMNYFGRMPQNTAEGSIQNCLNTCADAGHLYAAVQAGNECWCDDSYGSHSQKPDSECEAVLCQDTTGDYCGGYSRNKVMKA